ncbi:MAG: ATP-binding protein [Candidatus Omnitrophica bacterium]|nr:ATP-binding protein [Candidatus Omnitrophota bacterium]
MDKHSEIEGTGLGLSIVKDIIDLHNGHITVKSELGKNTEFKVVLPSE